MNRKLPIQNFWNNRRDLAIGWNVSVMRHCTLCYVRVKFRYCNQWCVIDSDSAKRFVVIEKPETDSNYLNDSWKSPDWDINGNFVCNLKSKQIFVKSPKVSLRFRKLYFFRTAWPEMCWMDQKSYCWYFF